MRLDAILGRKNGDIVHNVVFSTDLLSGHFLIIDFELEGGGTNSSNGVGDEVCFRAYRASGNRFAYVASTGAPTYSAWSKSNQQILYVSSVGTKSAGQPNFLYLAPRNSSQPAAVSVACD